MKRALVLAAVLAAGSAMADMVSRDGSIRLYEDKPCTVPAIMLQVAPALGEQLRGGHVMYEGRRVNLCWLASDDRIYIVDEDGDSGALPVGAFKREVGI